MRHGRMSPERARRGQAQRVSPRRDARPHRRRRHATFLTPGWTPPIAPAPYSPRHAVIVTPRHNTAHSSPNNKRRVLRAHARIIAPLPPAPRVCARDIDSRSSSRRTARQTSRYRRFRRALRLLRVRCRDTDGGACQAQNTIRCSSARESYETGIPAPQKSASAPA